MKLMSSWSAALLMMLVAIGPGAQAQLWGEATSEDRRVPGSQAEVTLSYAPLVKRAAPAVVNVYTERIVQRSVSPFANDPVFREFFGPGPTRPRVEGSLGSGVIVSADGVIVTNAHVVKGAESLRIVLSDRREFDAELVLADERTDLAVLRIDTGGEALPTLDYADTRGLQVGDLVLAIGNPFGVGQTVTSGIVSATARTDVGVSDYAFFLQTDAAINPGNSGGALIDMQGRLVGVNTAIFSRSGGSNGIGFSIPAEMVRRVVDAAVNEGRIVRPWLGLKGEAVTSDMAESLGLKRPVGVLITEVYPGGPAANAGLRSGDVVTAIDGREVFDEKGLKFLAATFGTGDKPELTFRRAASERRARVTLAPPPGATEADLVLLRGDHPFIGAEVAELSPALAEELGGDPFAKGLLVTRIMRGGYARRFLRPGDIIVGVNGERVETLSDFEAALELAESEGWSAAIERNGRRIEGPIPL
jgi:Do/DeqQ family serine protease